MPNRFHPNFADQLPYGFSDMREGCLSEIWALPLNCAMVQRCDSLIGLNESYMTGRCCNTPLTKCVVRIGATFISGRLDRSRRFRTLSRPCSTFTDTCASCAFTQVNKKFCWCRGTTWRIMSLVATKVTFKLTQSLVLMLFDRPYMIPYWSSVVTVSILHYFSDITVYFPKF